MEGTMPCDFGRQEGETAAEWLIRLERTNPNDLPHVERNNFFLAQTAAEEAVREEQAEAQPRDVTGPRRTTETFAELAPSALARAQAAVRALTAEERGQLQLWMLRGMA